MGLPIINLSLIPTFPAKVTGDGPTTIVKNGLEYVIGWDIETFSVNLNPGANTSLLGFDPDADETGLVPIAEIATPTIDARLADEPTAIAGVNNTDLMTPLRVSDQIEARSTSTVDLAAIGKMPVFVNAFGRPSLHSTGSTYFLSEGAYTDTMNWYFQRQANYTGGGAGDSTAGVLSPIRGETYIGPNVTYAVEAGGVFLSNNRSFLCQSVGSTSQSNVYEGGRGWGSVHEVKTWQKVFSSANGNLTAGQTVFPVPNGYTPNKSTVAKNGVLLTRTTDFVDSSGTNLVMVAPVSGSDVIEFWRGDDLLATMGAEIDNFAGYGSDDLNPTSGNRLGVAVFNYRRDKRFNVDTHIGTGLAIINDPTDSYLTTDRGLKFIGKYRDTIDFTDSTATRYLMRFNDGGGLTKDGNLMLGGALGTFDPAGYGTICVGETTNGGLIRFGDGSTIGRVGAGTAFGVEFGSEGASDVVFKRNSSEAFRISGSNHILFGSDGTQNLGGPSNRGNTAYFTTGTINTSDARAKTDRNGVDIGADNLVSPLTEAELRAARRLVKEIGVFKLKAAVAEKGAAARLHVGMTVQRAMEIMESEGLDPWAYGIFCRDEVTKRIKKTFTRTVQKTEEVEEPHTYVEMRDGVPVQVSGTRKVKQLVATETQVVDEAGEPVFTKVPGREQKEMPKRDKEGTPVLDKDGNPIMEMVTVRVEYTVPVTYPVPVMINEEYDEWIDEPDGDLLGFRESELHAFILRGLAEIV